MAASQIFYDRVEIFVNGQQYLPNGQIRNFRINATYNTRVQQGMTPDGTAPGKTVGNTTIDSMSWTEYLPTAAEYVNWQQFCLANPNATFTIVPITIAANQPDAANFTVLGVNPTSIGAVAPGEGEAMTRDCTFNATSASNLN